jgi:hypothetical protein
VTTYGDVVNEHLRLTILILLKDQSDYALNESLILDLVQNFGFGPSGDKLRTQLAWLAEQGLIRLSGVEHCQVATLTRRGDDVAHGRATVPGVKKPRPGDAS